MHTRTCRTLCRALAALLFFTGAVTGAPAQAQEVSSPPPRQAPEKTETITAEHRKALADIEKFQEKVATCNDMKERMVRLRCYDDIAADMGLMTQNSLEQQRARLGTFGFWEIVSEKDPLGVETIYITLAPVSRLNNPLFMHRTPTVNVRCRQGVSDFYLDWKAPLNSLSKNKSYIQVISQVDGEPARQYNWSLSVDGFAAFSQKPVEYIRDLRNKRQLLLQLTPSGGKTETLGFEIGMLDQALDVLVARCYAAQ